MGEEREMKGGKEGERQKGGSKGEKTRGRDFLFVCYLLVFNAQPTTTVISRRERPPRWPSG